MVDFARDKEVVEMIANGKEIAGGEHHGPATRALATVCHGCGICSKANRKPQSRFGRLMWWHRTWCPAWAAHSRVYGPKDLSKHVAAD